MLTKPKADLPYFNRKRDQEREIDENTFHYLGPSLQDNNLYFFSIFFRRNAKKNVELKKEKQQK